MLLSIELDSFFKSQDAVSTWSGHAKAGHDLRVQNDALDVVHFALNNLLQPVRNTQNYIME
jgi:hypothetical protein